MADNGSGSKGQVFTPRNIVSLMLNRVGYVPVGDIYRRHIVDNSCGRGSFLSEAVKRFVASCDMHRMGKDYIKRGLEIYIHGIEIDPVLCRECVGVLDDTARILGIKGVKWDVRNEDAFSDMSFLSSMDFVVGNPPYVRAHHMSEEERGRLKEYCGVGKGAIDMYVAFFELGLRMMGKGGRLAYITPSAWTASVCAATLRRRIVEGGLLSEVIDCGSLRVFEGVSVCAMITLLSRAGNVERVPVYDIVGGGDRLVMEMRCSESVGDYVLGDGMCRLCFNGRDEVGLLNDVILSHSGGKYVVAKNGFATLRDRLFVVGGDEEAEMEGEPHIIPCVKLSKGKRCHILFPYDIGSGAEADYSDLSGKEKAMLARHADKYGFDIGEGKWWLYGRSQAIGDVGCVRVGVNTMIKDVGSIKLCVLPAGCGAYSGLYVVCSGIGTDIVCGIIMSQEFVDYVKLLGRRKNGGYYTFNSRELEDYVNYRLRLGKESAGGGVPLS